MTALFSLWPEHASVLSQSLHVLGPSVLRKDDQLSVRLAVSDDDAQTWHVIISGKHRRNRG